MLKKEAGNNLSPEDEFFSTLNRLFPCFRVLRCAQDDTLAWLGVSGSKYLQIIGFIYMVQHNYYLYITTNPSRTVLYTGVTNDLDRRLQEHLDDNMNDRKTFAGKYFCYNLVYYEWYPDIREAIGREKEIKGWIRSKKEKLIESFNPSWRFLNDPQEIAKGDLPLWHVGDEYWQPGSTQAPKPS